MRETSGHQRRSGGRERLLAAARDLFTRRGASNVGINDVTDGAGLARMTLYNNFPSKEALVLAVYEELAATELGEIRAMDTADQTEHARIAALFDHFDRKGRGADDRGCPFVHASLQAAEPAGPIHALVRSYKRALRDHVVTLLDQGRGNRPELADQILILLDGAVTERYLQGASHPMDAARRAAILLLRFSDEHRPDRALPRPDRDRSGEPAPTGGSTSRRGSLATP